MATLPNPLPELVADPGGRSLGLHLPAGRLIAATDEGPRPEPSLWHAEPRATPGDWTALGGPAARVGLLPVLVDTGDGEGGPGSWVLDPDGMSYPGDHDAEEVLVGFWEEYAAPDDEWPGLAEAAPGADPDVRAAEVADALVERPPARGAWHGQLRLALVPARRSADIPTVIGWTGPENQENDMGRLSAVLRSWEDRFGIRVVALGPSDLLVSVAAPPATLEEAEVVAAEHYAFCPDTVLQSGSGDPREYAETLIDARSWGFWWD
jgi:hypothetical protein